MADKFRIAVRKFDPFEATLAKIWDSFCKEYGCSLELDAVPMELHDLYEATIGKEKGLANGDWDVAHLNTDWITEAHHLNYLEDLSAYIKNNPPENYPSGWSNSLLDLQVFDNKTFGLPFHDGPECLIFRKDLFEDDKEKQAFLEQYGRELKPPTTWYEYIEVAHFFNRPEKNLWGSAFAMFPDGHNTVFDFCLQLWSHGGTLVDKKGGININTPEAIEALEFYKSTAQNKSISHPKSADFDSVALGLAFANGELAMMINWFGFASMAQVIPESKVKDAVDITTIPGSTKGKEKSLNVYWLYTLGKGSKNKQIAYDFIRYAVSIKNDKLLTTEGGIGCRKSTWKDDEINQLIPFYHKLEKLHTNANTLPKSIHWNAISKIIDQLVITFLNTDKNAAELVKKAQYKIENI